MRKQITRFLSGILTVVMLLSSMYVPVMADGACDHVGTGRNTLTVSWNGARGCLDEGTVPIECSSCHEIVSSNTVPAKSSHTWNLGVCDVCNVACDHDGEDENYTEITATGHKLTYEDCHLGLNEAHNFIDGVCSECHYECGHTTWTNGKCSNCDIDHNHEGEAINYPSHTATGHSVAYLTCGLTKTNEAHTFVSGNCVCGYKCQHPDSQKRGSEKSNDDKFHKIICGVAGCGATISENAAHTYSNGVCTTTGCTHTCKHTEESKSIKTRTATGHTFVYANCKKEVTTAHTWSNGVCLNCNYTCLHGSYSDGNCTKCGKEHDHTNEECSYEVLNVTHKKIYAICGKLAAAEENHSYDATTHKCVCGKEDPDTCKHPAASLKYIDNKDGKTHTVQCGVETCKITVSANEVHSYLKGICACGAIDPECKHESTKTCVDTGDGKLHKLVCDICGKDAGTESHAFKNGTCSKCGAGSPCGKNHTPGYRSSTDTKHEKYCTVCDVVISTSKCSWIVSKDSDDRDDDEHYEYCKYCSNDRYKSHSFSYDYSDSDKHKKSCSCGLSSEQSCDYDGNKCKLCGHEKSSSSSSSSSSGTYYYVPTDIESLRKAGTALAKDVVSIKVNGTLYDVAATEAPLRDMFNQYYIGNILLTQLGYNVLTPTKTYKFASYNYYAAPGSAQTIVWKNVGLKAGDVAYVIYWNPTHKIQLLPCVVGLDGSATFTVPDINGCICTLVKCEKVEIPTTTKKKK